VSILTFIQLHILEANMVDNVNRQKAVACLSAIYRAILAGTTIAAIPNIEFVFSVEDLPALPTKPIWSLARRVQDHGLWLMPDFGFWSWDMPSLGTIDQVTREVVEREAEEPWDRKTEKLVWRGKINYAPKLRRALLDAAKDKPWSDVRPLKWANANSKDEFLGPVDQCDYAMIAHAEGMSIKYSKDGFEANKSPHRPFIFRLTEVSSTLPLRHYLAQTPMDTTLPLPPPLQRLQPKFRRSRA
jgi:hypothetical protein